MSGRRQHIIPRLLLKGFVSRRAGKEVYVWMFRREGRPFETNINNVGVESVFYCEPGTGSPDQIITDFETEHVSLVDDLRAESTSQRLEGGMSVARYVAHLAIRTKKLRESYVQGITYIAKRIRERLKAKNAARKLLENHLRKEPNALLQELEQGPPLTSKEKKRVLKMLGKKSKLLRAIDAPFRAAAEQHVETLIQRIAPEVKETHSRILREHPAPTLRAEELRALRWRLEVNPAASLILSDAAVLFQLGGTDSFKALTESGDVIARAFLPLSPTHLLVGEGSDLPPASTTEELNQVMARCSHEHFVAATQGHAQTALQQEIGCNPMFELTMLDEIIEPLLRERFG